MFLTAKVSYHYNQQVMFFRFHFKNIKPKTFKNTLNLRFYTHKMSEPSSNLLERARNIVPQLDIDRHKGQAGRIGIFGGSLEYTGACYFAGRTF